MDTLSIPSEGGVRRGNSPPPPILPWGNGGGTRASPSHYKGNVTEWSPLHIFPRATFVVHAVLHSDLRSRLRGWPLRPRIWILSSGGRCVDTNHDCLRGCEMGNASISQSKKAVMAVPPSLSLSLSLSLCLSDRETVRNEGGVSPLLQQGE